MKKVIHFNTQEERIAYLKGEFQEIIPAKAKKKAKKEEKVEEDEPKKAEKPKKSAKKGKKDEVQAE